MGAWPAIKKAMTEDTRPGSVGYYLGVAKAALIFADIATFLKNHKAQIKEFNADSDVPKAIRINGCVKLVEVRQE